MLGDCLREVLLDPFTTEALAGIFVLADVVILHRNWLLGQQRKR